MGRQWHADESCGMGEAFDRNNAYVIRTMLHQASGQGFWRADITDLRRRHPDPHNPPTCLDHGGAARIASLLVAAELGEACASSTVLPWAAVRLGEADLADVYRGENSQCSFQDVLQTGHRAIAPRAAAGLFDSSPKDRWMAEERYELAEKLLTGDLPADAVPALAGLVAEKSSRYDDDLEGAREALERLIEICRIQYDLTGELAAREALNLRHYGGHRDGVLAAARQYYVADDLDQGIELYQRVTA